MEQLIFIGIIVLFSILEAVGRKKRAQGQGQGGEGDETATPLPPQRPEGRRAPPAPAPRDTGVASYDDDAVLASQREEGRPRRPEETSGSEGLIPAEVWDEIQRMARGELPGGSETPPQPRTPPRPAPAPAPGAPARPAPKPRESPRSRSPAGARRSETRAGARPQPPLPAPIRGRAPVAAVPPPPPAVEEVRGERSIFAKEAGLGEPVRDRLSIYQAGMRERARKEAADARRLIRSGNAESLRKAVILTEVLGAPVALRE